MTNWTLRDLANNTYTFPAFALAAFSEVKVWTNSGTNDAANLYWGRNQAVWNNTGDTAIVRGAAPCDAGIKTSSTANATRPPPAALRPASKLAARTSRRPPSPY